MLRVAAAALALVAACASSPPSPRDAGAPAPSAACAGPVFEPPPGHRVVHTVDLDGDGRTDRLTSGTYEPLSE